MPNLSSHRMDLKIRPDSLSQPTTEQSIGETEKNLRSKESATVAPAEPGKLKGAKPTASTLTKDHPKAIASNTTKAR